MTRFVHQMRIQSPCSEAILESLPNGFFPKELYTKTFRCFAKRITLQSLPVHLKKNFDTFFIFEYEKHWLPRREDDEKIDSLETFIEKAYGFYI